MVVEDTGTGRRQTGEGRRTQVHEEPRLPSSVFRLPAPGVAVLALQGDFEAHRKKLGEIGVESFEARRPGEIEDAAGLIIPGGESTTLWKFFESAPWEEAIARFAASGRPVLGTCAGAIVLAREVSNPAQKSLALLDIAVERNAYGRQVDSFVGSVDAPALGGELPAVFIRAPKIRRVGSGVEVLARLGGEPVLVRQDNVVAATFHPELTEDERVHRLCFDSAARQRRSA
jgi:5'-phosphate synthase pdxT subunit